MDGNVCSRGITVSFFSRKNGWPGGKEVKSFHSSEFSTTYDITFLKLQDQTGLSIYTQLQKISNLPDNLLELLELAQCHQTWYFYFHHPGKPIIISTTKSLI